MPDTPDVESYLDPVSINRAVRGGEKLKGVQPDLLNHWNALQGEFSKAGITPEIKSGFRTAKDQQNLYNNPRTRALTKGNDGINKISPHQEGRALDISFNASQRGKGRQIIADYAQRNGLTIPGDEPWHITLPRQSKSTVESYLDPQQPTQATPAQKQTVPNVEDYLDPRTVSVVQPRNAETNMQSPSVPRAGDSDKALLPEALRRVYAPLAQDASDVAGAETEGYSSKYSKRISKEGAFDSPTLRTMRQLFEGRKAPQGLQQTAGSELALPTLPRSASSLTPQVTSGVKPVDFEGPTPQEPQEGQTLPAPLGFKQGTVAPENPTVNPVGAIYNELSKPDNSVRGIAGLQSKKYESPESRQLGDRVTLPISPHITPSEDEVVNGYLSTLGPDYVKAGEQYKAQTGHSILTLGGGALKQDEKGSYYVRPSKGAVDFINTYIQSGGDLSKAMAEAQRQADEHVAAENKAVELAKPDVAEAKAAERTAKDSPVLRGMIGGTAGAAQAFGSVLPGSLGDEFQRQSAVERAAAEQVNKDAPLASTEDRIKAGIGGLIPTAAMLIATHKLGPAQLAALGILEGSTPQERLRGGLQGATAQAVLGGAPTSFSEAGLPTTGKAVTSAAMVGQPAVEAMQRGESPVQAITENLPFAALPFIQGKGGGGERPTDLGIERAERVGVPGEATANIDQRLAAREAAVKPVTDAQGNVLLNPEEVAQGAKPKIKLANNPTPEPAHPANFQVRDKAGKFDGPAVYPDEFKPENVSQPASEPNTVAQPATESAASAAPQQAAQPVSTETTAISPVKTSSKTETKPSRLGLGVEAKAVEAKLAKSFEGLPEYETVKVKDQAERATKLLDDDPEMAKRIAMGRETPPSGLLPESVFTAVENQALKRGDVDMLRDLATASTLPTEASGMGQRIRMLAERNPISAVSAMRDVQLAREARVAKKFGGIEKAKNQIKTEIRLELKQAAPKAREWSTFLDQLTCK